MYDSLGSFSFCESKNPLFLERIHFILFSPLRWFYCLKVDAAFIRSNRRGRKNTTTTYAKIAQFTPISSTLLQTNTFFGHLLQITLFKDSLAFWVCPCKHLDNNESCFFWGSQLWTSSNKFRVSWSWIVLNL